MLQAQGFGLDFGHGNAITVAMSIDIIATVMVSIKTTMTTKIMVARATVRGIQIY